MYQWRVKTKMKEIERVRSFLQAKNPAIRIIEFEQDTSTSFLAAQALGTEVGQIAKSMLFKSKKDDYIMVVSTGDVKIDAKAVKDLVGARVRMANEGEVLDVTGFPVGGVCPFALKSPVPVYLDESLKRYEVVYAAAGTANTAVPITYQQLMEITGGRACQVSIGTLA
jgi:prolyl-tRNA editing enzyme YbaK/EbsC (Cys-tRNA(Pro) deacylase)